MNILYIYICILNLKFPGFQLFGIYFGVAITKKMGVNGQGFVLQTNRGQL